jgi:hypothetical protein
MRRRRRSEPTQISALLERWLSRKGLRAELLQYEILVRWPELVGDRLAAHTEPAIFKDGKLTVRVGSSAWLHELSFLRADVAQKINAGLGDERVTEIRLVAGPVRRRRRRAEEPQPVAAPAEPVPAALLGEIEAALSGIEDEGLREAVRRAALARLRCSRG